MFLHSFMPFFPFSFSELPILRKNAHGEWGNQTWFLHPISRIIQPRGQRVTCSKLFPQQWKLANGDYICKAGRDILPCKAPSVLSPDSADLHNQLDESFHLSMGHGITSTAEMKANQMRANEGAFQRNLQAEILFRNHKNIAQGRPLEPEGSPIYADHLKQMVAQYINPVFAWLGEGFQYFLGLVVLASMIMGVIGAVYRLVLEFRAHGCSPTLILALFSGIYTIFRQDFLALSY